MYQRISIHLYGYQECIELDGGAGNCHPFKVTKSIVCNSVAQLVNQQMSLFREDSNGSSKGKLKKRDFPQQILSKSHARLFTGFV